MKIQSKNSNLEYEIPDAQTVQKLIADGVLNTSDSFSFDGHNWIVIGECINSLKREKYLSLKSKKLDTNPSRDNPIQHLTWLFDAFAEKRKREDLIHQSIEFNLNLLNFPNSTEGNRSLMNAIQEQKVYQIQLSVLEEEMDLYNYPHPPLAPWKSDDIQKLQQWCLLQEHLEPKAQRLQEGLQEFNHPNGTLLPPYEQTRIDSAQEWIDQQSKLSKEIRALREEYSTFQASDFLNLDKLLLKPPPYTTEDIRVPKQILLKQKKLNNNFDKLEAEYRSLYHKFGPKNAVLPSWASPQRTEACYLKAKESMESEQSNWELFLSLKRKCDLFSIPVPEQDFPIENITITGLQQLLTFNRKWQLEIQSQLKHVLPWDRQKVSLPKPPYQASEVNNFALSVRPYINKAKLIKGGGILMTGGVMASIMMGLYYFIIL